MCPKTNALSPVRPWQPQLAKLHCPFEGDRAILIEKVIDIKFSAFHHIQSRKKINNPLVCFPYEMAFLKRSWPKEKVLSCPRASGYN